MKLRLYIVDDEIMANQYMIYLLERIGTETEVVGQSTNSMKAYHEIIALKPDVVFADINMPVLDGLALAEKILSKISVRIIFLTSYKDFDFIKKGMQLGAADYVLKNELNEEYLDNLLSKIQADLEMERLNQHVILEHNIRQFLRSDSGQMEDHTYEDRPMQRYGLIYMIPRPRIYIHRHEEDDMVKVDSALFERLSYPDGITCNAVAEMSRGELCAIFFIDEQSADGQLLLQESADIIEKQMECMELSYCCLVSDTRHHFWELPDCYRLLKKLSDQVYALLPVKRILLEKELADRSREEIHTDEWISRIDAALQKQDQAEAWKCLQDFFRICREKLGLWEYTENVRAVYRYLKEYIDDHGLRKAILDIPESYDSAQELEKTISECLALVFESSLQQEKSEYSVYVQMAIAYICHNYSRDISIPEIAEALNISDGHLRRLFRQEVGMKVLDYLTEYRLECAKLLMRSKGRSLTEIWQKTGFASAQYFSYVFKRKEGILPKDYMKQYREDKQ